MRKLARNQSDLYVCSGTNQLANMMVDGKSTRIAGADTPERYPTFSSEIGRMRMLGGHAALDIVNSAHMRDGEKLDFVPDFDSLCRWCVPAGLLTESESDEAQRLALSRGAEAAALHREWLTLRNVLRQLLGARAQATSNTREHESLEMLSRIAATSITDVRFIVVSRSLRPMPSDPLKLPLLRSVWCAIEASSKSDSWDVRSCGADECGGLFLNQSRSHPRRWCSMDGCGAKMKQRAYRNRLRSPE